MFYSLNKILVECYSVPGSVLDTEVQGQARQIGSLLLWLLPSNGGHTINK